MVMKIPRIYIDTSVIGGCFDDEFNVWSNALFDDLRKGLFKPMISSVVTEEIKVAPDWVKKQYEELLKIGARVLSPDKQSFELIRQYEKHEIIPIKFRNDMLHIAVATIAEADILVSWNFKHIVRYDKIQQFNAVNIENGYKAIAIYSPREVTYYEKI
jgi:hypothetical protein